MNVVILYGRLTRDPELKYSQGGVANCFTTVAVDRGMTKEKRQQAEAAGQPTADFIGIKAFGKTAELLANYFRKGNRVALEGRIQTGSYEKGGERVYTTDVIVNRLHFVESAKENAGGNSGSFAPMNGQAGYYEVNEKDIPF